jgi:hypothetical protein
MADSNELAISTDKAATSTQMRSYDATGGLDRRQSLTAPSRPSYDPEALPSPLSQPILQALGFAGERRPVQPTP